MCIRNLFLVIVLTLVAFGIGACGPEQNERIVAEPEAEIQIQAEQTHDVTADDEVIISYGDKKLTMRHIEYLSPGADTKMIKRIAEWWLNIQLFAEEAVKQGIDKTEAVKFKKQLRIEEMYAESLKYQLRTDVKVADADILAYYEKNKQDNPMIKKPKKLSFSHVSTKTSDQAQEVFERIKKGEDINAIAKELSVHPDGPRGGIVKEFTEEVIDRRFGPAFSKALLAVPEGELTGPVACKGSRYEVIRLDGVIAGRVKTFDEVKAQIKRELTKEAANNAMKNMTETLESKAADKIKRSELLLKEDPAKKR